MPLFFTKRKLEGFEECVSPTKFIMSITGIWPESLSQGKGPLRYSSVIIIAFLILFFLIAPQGYRLYLFRNDFNEVMDIIALGIVVLSICLLKLLGIVIKAKETIREDWKKTTKEEQVIMWRKAKLCRLVACICLIPTYNNCTLLYLRVLTHNYFSSDENGTVDRPMVLKSEFFFEYKESPNYDVLIFMQYISCLAAATVYSSFDGVFVFTVSHVTGQFYNLRRQVKNLAKSESRDGFKKNLGNLVRRHQSLKMYCTILEENFNKMLLLQNLATAVLICLQAYFFIMFQVTSNNYAQLIPELIFTVTYVSASLISVFMYCYFADQLRSESELLNQSIFKMTWYELPTNESKLLVTFMINTLKPVEVTVGKLTKLDLAYYCSLIKSSGGYLSMLLAMKDKVK